MQIDLLDNTTHVFGVSTPGSFLRGLDPRQLDFGGLGQDTPAIDPITGLPITGPAGLSLGDTITGAIAAVNAEADYLKGQVQAAQGLPVTTGSKPGITVGLSPDTQKLVIVGGAAVLAAFFLLRRR